MELTIRISTATLWLAARDADTGSIEHEQYRMRHGVSAAANLRIVLADSALAKKAPSSATVVVDTPVMLVPLAEHEENGEPTTTYNATFGTDISGELEHVVLPAENAIAVFSVAPDLRTVVADRFPTYRFVPLMQPLWAYLHHRSFTGTRRKLFVFFHDKQAEVTAYRHTQFLFYNRFDAIYPDDTMFYVLGVWKELGFDTAADELHLAGTKPTVDMFRDAAERFLKNVFVVDAAADFNYALHPDLIALPLDMQTLFARGR